MIDSVTQETNALEIIADETLDLAALGKLFEEARPNERVRIVEAIDARGQAARELRPALPRRPAARVFWSTRALRLR